MRTELEEAAGAHFEELAGLSKDLRGGDRLREEVKTVRERRYR